MDNTIQTIKQILANLKHSEGLAKKLGDTSNIIEDVGLDSLEMLQFMLEIEDRLAIKVDFNLLEFEHLSSIQLLADFLNTMPSREANPG